MLTSNMNYKALKIFWWILFFILDKSKFSNEKHVQISRLDGSCPGQRVLQILICPQRIIKNSKLIMNCTMTAKEDIPTTVTVTFSIQRCRSQENLDSCEDFYKQELTKSCRVYESQMGNWNTFTSSFTPRWTCPLKKGRYQSLNTTLDIAALLLFPIENWFWKITTNTRNPDTGKLIMCIILEVRTY